MAHANDSDARQPLNLAVLTVSDTRGPENDTSGDYLQQAAEADGHDVVRREIVVDDMYKIRAIVAQWVADDAVHAVLITGGTGFTSRDSTPEAVAPLFDKEIVGYGELFRAVSYEEIGTSTIQSRTIAGVSNRTLIFCIPGSTGACRTAWGRIISEQLDSRHKPCNFVEMVRRRG
ncbi:MULTISPECIES: molybdenum cofactor biosynthesis protein B [Neptunomonas]|uniref:Molybdenum cofactor biosynthesis protein B n=1 Tax=Neptunomonas marina TaxID=1815562 RepID=A0A437Q7K5_9GAMM|nr:MULTISPECIES: molybdenum cofactor biosynthesis protein B [Neptunomonas]RVU30456.1 molybdenum cofactor biosynthesis protein B [Neptunomonas marina]